MAYLPDACTEMEHTDDSCPLIQLTSSLVTGMKQLHQQSTARSPMHRTLYNTHGPIRLLGSKGQNGISFNMGKGGTVAKFTMDVSVTYNQGNFR